MNPIGMMRVKNEARWIAEVLSALKQACPRVYVMDDHSTDATAQICRDLGAVVFPSPFNGIDESRDKTWLVEQIAKHHPDGSWVVCIDGDEVLAQNSVGPLLSLLDRREHAFSFRVLYLWDSRDQIRVDGVYKNFRRPSMFRLQRGQNFRRTDAAGNFHCSSVPREVIGRVAQAPVDLLHLGYMDREDRIRKWEWYVQKDPHNSVEDGYRHIVIGDVFPADAVFRHAGPLQLEVIDAQ